MEENKPAYTFEVPGLTAGTLVSFFGGSKDADGNYVPPALEKHEPTSDLEKAVVEAHYGKSDVKKVTATQKEIKDLLDKLDLAGIDYEIK